MKLEEFSSRFTTAMTHDVTIAKMKRQITDLQQAVGNLNQLVVRAGLNPKPTIEEITATVVGITNKPARRDPRTPRTPIMRDLPDLGGDPGGPARQVIN